MRPLWAGHTIFNQFSGAISLLIWMKKCGSCSAGFHYKLMDSLRGSDENCVKPDQLASAETR